MTVRPLILALALSAGLAAPLAARPAKKPRTPATAARATFEYGTRADALRFADAIAERNGLDAAWVRERLAQARFQPAVVRAVLPPPSGTAKNWSAYRARFVEPRRIAAGAAFWQAHAAALERAEREFGVPAEIVVGIVGVETFYGRHSGGFRVIDALATLAFDFPVEGARKDRSGFFRDELEQLFALAQRAGFDPLDLRGSYAGASGLPQFMPSSLARWALDYDADGRIDLLGSPEDAIGSVAHYLAEHGWVPGLATHFDVEPPGESSARALLLVPDIVPTFGVAEMAAQGALLGPLPEGFDGPLALVELHNGAAAPSYVAGTRNFYALTRYNQSSYYALAVIELGRAVARERSAAAQAVGELGGQ